MRLYYITLLFTIILILFGCKMIEDHWDNFINIQKSLGYEVLSIEASETWIKKHSDEISLPDKIEFGKPHQLQDFGFAPYNIMIAVDMNNKYRVIARELPPDKTLLKVGDTLLPFTPFMFSRKTFTSTKENAPIEIDWKNEINTYVFEAKETIVQPILEKVSETNVRIKPLFYEVLDLYDFKCTTYMSPNGATISYKYNITDEEDSLSFIVTKIDGPVFKRNHNLSPWNETNQEDILPNNKIDQWDYFLARKKLLGCEVLGVRASKAWIQKHSEDIYIPDIIIFGKPYYVQDRFFVPYGIMIAVDWEYNYRVIARKLPPDKTLLKVGDTLTMSFISYTDPGEFLDVYGDILGDLSNDSVGDPKTFIKTYNNLLESNIRNFSFEAKEKVIRLGIPVPQFEEIDFEEIDYMSLDKNTVYMSPNGATISYNGKGIITKIEGSVFQRIFDFTEIATSLLTKDIR